MKISRLRLLGFKSFVEPTDLLIEPGLTGVVGPNGCGKSNLLEALRWVMGETSYKSMRASAMDDVIFSGTTSRPARNNAEVTLFLDNTERQAPAEYNDVEEIEIARRIEREAGSAYRINGREARARDIKILFEDASTGARSPSLVRQGQIANIVNSKPEQRRRILEDAAGIAGLHSRRHEAELRLKAAENNLARLADLIGQLGSQVESLKRQARAARRYKEVSAQVRQAEALLAHLVFIQAQEIAAAEQAELEQAQAQLASATEDEARAIAKESELASAIEPLRAVETEKAGVLGRLRIEAETIDREAERAQTRASELQARSEQLESDIAREKNFVTESAEVLTGLENDIANLAQAQQGSEAEEARARVEVEAGETELAEKEETLAKLTQAHAEARAGISSLERTLTERDDLVAKTERQLAALKDKAGQIASAAPDATKLSAAIELGQELARKVVDAEALVTQAEEKAAGLNDKAAAGREAAAKSQLRLSALITERETLTRMLAREDTADFPPVLDALTVAPGYEKALGAALGDDLEAPTDVRASVHWAGTSGSNAGLSLPDNTQPLSEFVSGASELGARLSQVGVVSENDGARLQASLKPGQRLVSRSGDLWRWDGFVAGADGTTAAAQRLAQKNRLSAIADQERSATSEFQRLKTAENEAVAALREAEATEREGRQNWRTVQAELSRNREALTVIERAARETEAKLASVEGATAAAEEELKAHVQRLEHAKAELEAARAREDLSPRVAEAQQQATEKRTKVAELRAALAGLQSERRQRAERLQNASAELERWKTRRANAEKQIGELDARRTQTLTELEDYRDLPAKIEARRQELLTAISQADAERKTAGDRFAEADTALKAAAQALRATQSQVGEAREARARIEARLEAATERLAEEERRIRDTLHVAPAGCLALAGIDENSSAPLPDLETVDRQLIRLKADRERLGGVNLQADEELEKLNEQFVSMDSERADVEEAVAKLRGGIAQLNREAKKRLQDAFDVVNGHFGHLFTTLFGGGEARLEMIQSEEDPMHGGLEIIARPPGKKPATLSLLSGGEQTLTALSLIFAVFLTNPSPICVLDEVDAPLDDANVERFCTLMEKMSEETATRFLVITHHPMTMARMNRLYGVTMAEKGVSQLVSVDLETARSFREAS